jgi:hypothetical protein
MSWSAGSRRMSARSAAMVWWVRPTMYSAPSLPSVSIAAFAALSGSAQRT